MKQLVCEMCGSSDLMKQDGVFVCQNCGMKYSLEEAKKMMIEGTVDVQGTIKVDNSAFVEKYLANARRAKEKEDWEEVEKYYNMVEQNDPNNIEAIFYSAYGKAKISLTVDEIYKREAVFKVLKNCISLLDDKYDVERAEENKNAITGIAEDLGAMLNSSFVYTKWEQNGYVTKTNKSETINLFKSLLVAFKETIENIQKIDDQPYLHDVAIGFYNVAISTGYWDKTTINKWISNEKEKLAELNLNIENSKVKNDKEKYYSEFIEKCRVNDLQTINECIRVFTVLDEYKDSPRILKYCQQRKLALEKEALYKKSLHLVEQGEFVEAFESFGRLGKYKDSDDQIKILKEKAYNKASAYLDDNKYESAKVLFRKIGDYKDSLEKLNIAEGKVKRNDNIGMFFVGLIFIGLLALVAYVLVCGLDFLF